MLSMGYLIAILLLSTSLIISCVSSKSFRDECNGKDYGSAGQFDFYVLAQSWPPNFCSSHMSYPGCQNPTAWQETNLTLHGLWPNYNQMQGGNHYWPQCCQSTYGSSITSSEMNPILSALQTYWPSEQNPSPNGDWSNSLWQHEWGKHGTCSGLPVTQYFNFAMSLTQTPALSTPPLISNNLGSTVSTSALLSYYTNGQTCNGNGCMVSLNCANKNGASHLAGITTCWSKTGQQVQCPQGVIGKATCTQAQITIDSFNGLKSRTKVPISKRISKRAINKRR